ncbi:zinc ribbon domain-containing protein [Spelaeicoccus albus]|uniref:CT398-like coiled coil hairpin domain-containing protein n=1 Tax=Spelaeicoccus albus TaxID=1280376 RepID=A0A7Z0D3P8_9MICO|nr:hypothetical protein [Spelaeicoccus albus]NYI68312.1 hypothetical protein [Spelaeicoccus albus]
MATAPAADQAALLKLQAIDSKLLGVAHRERTLAEHAKLEENAKRLADAESRLAEAEAGQREANSHLRESEMAVEQVQNKIDKDQSRLDSGSGSSKDLTALQTDIAHLTDRRGELEMDELEKMEAVEAADEAVNRVQAELDGLNAESAEISRQRDDGLEKLAAERDGLTAERAGAADGIDAALLQLYDSLRERLGGVAAAAVRSGACDACGQMFSPSELQQFSRAEEDFVLRCPECDRILIRA